MTKIIISIHKLIELGVLKDTLNNLDFDENDPRNIKITMTKDYVNKSLPKKYRHFTPPDDDIAINLSDQVTLLVLSALHHQPLTDYEIMELLDVPVTDKAAIEFARAIEKRITEGR